MESLTYASNLPVSLDNPTFSIYSAGSVVIGNKIFSIGGVSLNKETNCVYYANILEDGELSEWHIQPALPKALSNPICLVINNKLYVFGGLVSYQPVDSVYSSNIHSDGTLGKWTTEINLPKKMIGSSIVYANGYLYLIGGFETSCGTISKKVYISTVYDNGTICNWGETNSLPRCLFRACAVVDFKQNIQLFGGYDIHGISNIVTISKKNVNGTVDKWLDTYKTIEPLSSFNTIVLDNYVLFITWNIVNDLSVAKVYYARRSLDGSIGHWTPICILPITVVTGVCCEASGRLYITFTAGIDTPKAGIYYLDLNQYL